MQRDCCSIRVHAAKVLKVPETSKSHRFRLTHCLTGLDHVCDYCKLYKVMQSLIALLLKLN